MIRTGIHSPSYISWKISTMRPMSLRLPLTQNWFDLTKQQIKTEDYREITPYWFVRLFEGTQGQSKFILQEFCEGLKSATSACRWNYDNGYFSKFKSFTHNQMTLGYPSKNAPERIVMLEHAGIVIGEGNPDWGAEIGKIYFVIKHGKVICT